MPSEMLTAANSFLSIFFFFLKEGLGERQFPTYEPPDIHCIYDCLAHAAHL